MSSSFGYLIYMLFEYEYHEYFLIFKENWLFYSLNTYTNMQINTHCLFSIKNIFAQARVSFIHHKDVLCGEIVHVLIKHNNLGCGCLAGCWNQLTDAKSLLKNVHFIGGGELIRMKLNNWYLNWGYVNFIIQIQSIFFKLTHWKWV